MVERWSWGLRDSTVCFPACTQRAHEAPRDPCATETWGAGLCAAPVEMRYAETRRHPQGNVTGRHLAPGRWGRGGGRFQELCQQIRALRPSPSLCGGGLWPAGWVWVPGGGTPECDRKRCGMSGWRAFQSLLSTCGRGGGWRSGGRFGVRLNTGGSAWGRGLCPGSRGVAVALSVARPGVPPARRCLARRRALVCRAGGAGGAPAGGDPTLPPFARLLPQRLLPSSPCCRGDASGTGAGRPPSPRRRGGEGGLLVTRIVPRTPFGWACWPPPRAAGPRRGGRAAVSPCSPSVTRGGRAMLAEGWRPHTRVSLVRPAGPAPEHADAVPRAGPACLTPPCGPVPPRGLGRPGTGVSRAGSGERPGAPSSSLDSGFSTAASSRGPSADTLHGWGRCFWP